VWVVPEHLGDALITLAERRCVLDGVGILGGQIRQLAVVNEVAHPLWPALQHIGEHDGMRADGAAIVRLPLVNMTDEFLALAPVLFEWRT